jgi:hypothetical protein
MHFNEKVYLIFLGLAAGAVDENDFIRAYTETPTVQVGWATISSLPFTVSLLQILILFSFTD